MSSLLLLLMLTSISAPVDTTEIRSSVEDVEAATVQPRPRVYLVVGEALAEWMVVRLLEDGYPLTASAKNAHVRLALVADAEGRWTVTATGRSKVVFDVEAATDPAVVRLELLHRSLDALEDVVPMARAAPQPVAVSLDVDELSPTFAPQIAAGILAAGATLVPHGVAAQLRVCTNQHPDEKTPRVFTVDGHRTCQAAPAPQSVESNAALLPTTTRVVATAMAKLGGTNAEVDATAQDVSNRTVPVAPEPEQDADQAPGLGGTDPDTEPLGAPFMLRGGVSGGLIGRVVAVDAVFAGWMTLGREPGLQGWAEFQARPIGSTTQFAVVELVPAFGLKFRPLSVRRFSLEMGGLLGAEIHAYRLRGPQGRAQGRHVAVSADSALGFAFEVWKRHEVLFALRVGGGSERIHHVDGLEIWRRRGLRVGAMVGFSFGKELAS